MGLSLQDYCVQHGREYLLHQWHPERNRPITAREVTYGSHRSIWWRCAAGHEWQAEVKSRTTGCGCPYCTNRTVLRQANDLATTHPWLAEQWDTERNGSLSPSDVVAGSKKQVWWNCEKGHTWKSSIVSRSRLSTGCPVCAGKQVVPGETDLATVYPELASQWDHEKNGNLTPEKVTAWSNRKVWWLCERGHGFAAQIGSRATKSSGCPYCTGTKVLSGFNDLATIEPQIAAQWHPTLNGSLTPEQVTPGSHKKVWWQCADEHIWKAVIYSRAGAKKAGCPVCAGKVKPVSQIRHAGILSSGRKASSKSVLPWDIDLDRE